MDDGRPPANRLVLNQPDIKIWLSHRYGQSQIAYKMRQESSGKEATGIGWGTFAWNETAFVEHLISPHGPFGTEGED